MLKQRNIQQIVNFVLCFDNCLNQRGLVLERGCFGFTIVVITNIQYMYQKNVKFDLNRTKESPELMYNADTYSSLVKRFEILYGKTCSYLSNTFLTKYNMRAKVLYIMKKGINIVS